MVGNISQFSSGKSIDYKNYSPMSGGKTEGIAIGGKEKSNAASGGCETCSSRKYQDGSNDPGVSFKTPTKIGSGQAAAAVAGHERQHVSREQAKADREDRKVISQSVRLKSAVCSECGKSYVSGGETTTVTKGESGNTGGFKGVNGAGGTGVDGKGKVLDVTA